MRALLPRSAWTVLALALYAGPAPGQFSAKGRQRPAPTTPASQPQRQNPRPAASSSPTAQRDILIARYEKLLLQQPGQPAVLSRLMELVRQRDGHLQELAKQLEALAARGGDDGYAGAMALAGIALEEGRQDDARQQFARARDMAPRRPEALVALAQLKASAGELEQAKADYERAAVLSHGLERQAIVRSLRDLSLEQGDLAAARAYHRKLTGAARGNVYLEGELARELLRRGQFDEAIAEAKRVAEANVGDNRALAPALRELGEAQLAASRFDDAKRSLERAARLSQNQPGLQLMIEGLLAEAHRGAGTLPEYLSQLSQTATRTDQLMLLGRLYEQAGRTDEAIKVYRQAAQRSPQDPDPRLSLVRLLELTSELKEATTQYQRLTRIAPKQTDLSLRYIELLLTQGERDAALREFDRTSRNARSDPDAALLLLDLAQRIGESARADALVRSLEANGHLQPQHLVELGSRAFRKGDEAHALSLWRRILDCSGKPEALSVTYGETLLGHEQLELGLSALQKAAEQAPDDSDVRRALARGYLRAASQSSGSRKQSYEQAALREWTRLLSVGTSQAADQRRRAEARRQVVRLFERTGQLEQRTRELQKEYQKNPSALETGRLLAQAQLEQGAPNQAERTLRAMLKVAPADREALHLLDQVQLEQGNLRASMETLKQLVRVNPSEAASLYETLSQRAMQLPDDALALRYAELAFERDQGSAEAQARLGDLYADQGEFARATEAYRAALAKNDRMNAVALRLAELLTKQGESQEALDLLLRVVRSARSDEELSQAGRTALTVGLFSGQARKLEDELRPLAIAMPARKPVRDLLLEVIAAEMLPLTKQLDYGSPEQRDQAASELLQLSLRCLPPLLVALSEGEPGQQQLAITALRYGTSESAGTALLEFAVSAAPEALRVEAVLAAGRHEDARLVGRFRRLLQGDDGPRRGRLARAALLGLAVIDTPAAHSAIQLGLASADPNLRVESLLVLGDQPQLLSDDELLATLTQSSSGPGPRAAAALALATRRADPAIASELRRAATDRHRLVRASALHALCALRPPDESGIELAARALYEPDEQLSQAALASLALSASPTEASRPLLESTLSADQLNERRLQIRGEELLWRKLLVTPSAEARAKALTKNQQYILAGATLSLRTSKASARKLQGFLRTSDDDSSLVPFFRKAADGPLLDEALRKDAEASSRALRTALVPLLVEHAQAADPETRAAALRSLQLSQGPNARAAIKSGLFSSEPLAVEAALDALRAGPADDAIDLLDELQSQETHQERPGSQSRRIAQLLETLGQQTEGASREQACDLLRRLAQNSEGLARSRALSALETLGAFER